MATIVTKNSSTASAVPTTSDLVQGELAVNVTDKRIFTENASTEIVELGTNPSTVTTGTATVTGTLTANGTFASNNAVITGGSINSTPIGATTASTVRGTTVTATTGFVGGLTGNVTGNLTGNVTGNVTGNLTGNVTGNVTASSGTTTLNDLVVNGTADFTNTKLTNITTPTADSDAANKGYVDATVAAVIDSAPAALDTLNELAAALGDDANFSATVTTALATKLPLAGGTMTGAIAMGTSKITGLGDPTASQDAATKTYVDTADALKLNLTGGTMSGAIAMGTNKITGVGDPTADQDAATKAYTDSILGSATSAADSAAAAATSASNAATSASNAASSATASASSASASASSAAAAASTYDDFDDRYLGDKASDPTLDNDGNALLTGALYFNTTTDVMRVYTGSAWQDVAISTNSPTFTGTVTADALTVNAGIITIGQESVYDAFVNSPESLYINIDSDNTQTGRKFQIGTNAVNTSGAKIFTASDNGDISFYEDTGTTPKFVWDASAESLGIGAGDINLSGVGTGGFNTVVTIQGNNQFRGILELANSTGVSSVDATVGDIAWFDNDNKIAQISALGQDLTNHDDGDLAFSTATGGTLSERMRIDSSGNVGIGTASPVSLLTIEGSTDNSAVTSSSTPFGLTIDNASTVVNSYSQISLLNGGLPSSQNDGWSIRSLYQANNDCDLTFNFLSNSGGIPVGAERLRIDSSGNLLVGKTAIDVTTAGVNLNSSGYVSSSVSGNPAAYFNRGTSDGNIAVFLKDGTTVGSIGTSTTSSNIFFTGASGEAGIELSGSAWLPLDNGTRSDGGIDLGASTVRHRDLYLSGGVYLGGTGAANKLDDYEEGTWTPVADFSTTSPSSGASNGVGRYVKIGNTVTVWATFTNINVTGAVGNINITGLPFTAKLNATQILYAGTIRVSSVNIANSYLSSEVRDGESYIRIMEAIDDADAAELTAGDFNDNSSDFFITLNYETA